MSGKTLYDKLWDAHRVREDQNGTCLIYIDRHLVHEVTSPQAFEGLRLAGRKPWRSGSVLAPTGLVLETMLNTLVRHTDTMQKLVEPLTRYQGEVEGLRNVVQQVLTPLAQRDRLAFELSNLATESTEQRSLTHLLDQIAEKGEFWAVLLSDQDGLPLAASQNAKDLNKLTAVSSLMLLLAERIGRDGAPAPLSVQIHDEANMATLCRIFRVNGQRLLLTAVSTGSEISPTALDPVLAKVDRVLAR